VCGGLQSSTAPRRPWLQCGGNECFPTGFTGGVMQEYSCDGSTFTDQCLLGDENSTRNTTDPDCAGECPTIARHSSAPPPHTIGTILVAVTIGTFAVYCAVGAGLQHRKGEHGRDLVPNREFWAEIPGLVKSGCKFTFGKAARTVQRARGFDSYENL
jgi:hypothetical protein